MGYPEGSGGETRRLVEPPLATVVAVPVPYTTTSTPGTVPAATPSAPPAEDEDEIVVLPVPSTPTAVPSAAIVPEAHGAQMVEVVSPRDLPGGYGFDAVFGGQVFTAIVPPGGVVKGQRFKVPFSNFPACSLPPPGVGGPRYPPRGRFRDGLCGCCNHGCCHPSLLNALCFPQILTAQVMTRMRMTWLGGRPRRRRRSSAGGGDGDDDDGPWRHTFRIVLLIVIAYIVATTVLDPYVRRELDVAEDGSTVVVTPPKGPQSLVVLNKVLGYVFGFYTVFILARTRWVVREAYAIPAGSPCGCDNCWGGCAQDVCCAVFCGCCTVSQLARHTADYEERAAACCSGTGLPRSDPALIV